MQANETSRPEKGSWRIIREGEISPYKITVTILIREIFIHVELRRGSPEERCANVRLIHNFITSDDMTYAEFKAHLEDPKNYVRQEILKRFNKVMNLEEVNASFLYELCHSVIDVDATQTNILRKRISKHSPFGKFLRIVLLNLRKMSYPQAIYMYQQLCAYLHPLVEFKKSCGFSKASLVTSSESLKAPVELPVLPVKDSQDGSQENIPVTQPQQPQPTVMITPIASMIPTISVPGLENKVSEQVAPPLPPPAPSKSSVGSSNSKGNKQERKRKKGLDVFYNMIQSRRKSSLLGLRLDIKKHYEHELKKASNLLPSSDEEKYILDQREKEERVKKALEATKSLRLAWQPTPCNKLSKFLYTVEEVNSSRSSSNCSSIDTSFLPKRQRQRSTPKRGGKSPRKSAGNSFSPSEINFLVDGDIDYYISDDEDVEKDVVMATPPTPTKRGTRSSSTSSSSIMKTPTAVKVEKDKKSSLDLKRKISVLDSTDTVACSSPSRIVISKPIPEDSEELVPASRRWKDIKYWSRKQIERTLKLLGADLYHTGGKTYLPSHISAFVEAMKENPSAQVLLPQLHYLEYLNCLRLKDLTRCTESLRTSFDLRIKPNTSELNKGTPYAAYNFAVFYHLMGYKKDSMLFLEEAFQAGHSAADSICLHYCHNLWSGFHKKPYAEAIVPVSKEVDKNMAYLHSLNVFANANDYHSKGLRPREILRSLWDYKANYEMEQIESLLLLSLGSFFSVFGWHDMVAFPCQVILYSSLRWPTRAYCAALCLLSQTILLEGGVKLATEMMNYGQRLFGLDSSSTGELFVFQHASFKAVSAYTGYRPVDDEIISTIAAFDKTEALYWRAYSKMINNDWEESEKLLFRLYETELDTTYDRNELKLRCLLLQAELQCLCGIPTDALKYLFEALALARFIYSDHYISLCLLHISSIQCTLGLKKAATRTMYQEIRPLNRSSCPFLKAKLNVVNVKLRIYFPVRMSLTSKNNYLHLLEDAEQIYRRWDNLYRLKEVLYLKKKLLEMCDNGDMEVSSSYSDSEFDAISPHLQWSPTTCLM